MSKRLLYQLLKTAQERKTEPGPINLNRPGVPAYRQAARSYIRGSNPGFFTRGLHWPGQEERGPELGRYDARPAYRPVRRQVVGVEGQPGFVHQHEMAHKFDPQVQISDDLHDEATGAIRNYRSFAEPYFELPYVERAGIPSFMDRTTPGYAGNIRHRVNRELGPDDPIETGKSELPAMVTETASLMNAGVRPPDASWLYGHIQRYGPEISDKNYASYPGHLRSHLRNADEHTIQQWVQNLRSGDNPLGRGYLQFLDKYKPAK